MCKYIYVNCKPAKKIKVFSTDILMSRNLYQAKEMFNSFIEGTRHYYFTAMRFPSSLVSVREQQVQRQNYDYFVHTMAELIKKYAPEITG